MLRPGTGEHAAFVRWCEHNTAGFLALVPDLIADMADECGVAAALQFVRRFGGQEIYVPVNSGKSALFRPEVVQEIGQDLLDMLVETYPNERISVPTLRSAVSIFRHSYIKECRARGHTVGEITRALSMHRRSVEKGRLARALPWPPGMPIDFNKLTKSALGTNLAPARARAREAA